MKSNFLKLLIFILVFTSCQKQEGYEINISATDKNEGTVFLFKDLDRKPVLIDSVFLTKGQGTFTGKIDFPTLYYLKYENNKEMCVLFIENSKIDIVFQSDNFKDAKISGSNTQIIYVDFLEKLSDFENRDKELNAVYETLTIGEDDLKIEEIETQLSDNYEQKMEFIKNSVFQYSNSLVGLYLIQKHLVFTTSFQELSEMLVQTGEDLHQTSIYTFLNERLNLLEQFIPGKTIPDFSLNDPDGKAVSIDDFKGKYLLIDFWASWCPPCRLENPVIVRIYNKYKSKGFEILGVSLDTKRDAWLEAIEKDNLKWKHVSDLQGWKSEAAQMFGIISIPSSILIDKNGIIVAYKPTSSEVDNILRDFLK